VYRSPEEVEKQYNEKMGPELGAQYNAVWQSVAWLTAKWETFNELYGVSPEQITILNRTAPVFFSVIQRVLFDDVLLHMSRLTDNPRIRQYDNLTITRITEMMPGESKAALAQQLEEAKEPFLRVRRIRDKRIAHASPDHALERSADPIEELSRSEVREALERLQKLLSSVSLAYGLGETRFISTHMMGGSRALVRYLEAGRTAEDARFAERRKGRGASGQGRASPQEDNSP